VAVVVLAVSVLFYMRKRTSNHKNWWQQREPLSFKMHLLGLKLGIGIASSTKWRFHRQILLFIKEQFNVGWGTKVGVFGSGRFQTPNDKIAPLPSNSALTITYAAKTSSTTS
jgi:hypothetical protein